MEAIEKNLEKRIKVLLEQDDIQLITKVLDSMQAHEIVHMVSHLNKADRKKLMTLLHPEKAAAIMEEMPDATAIAMIGDLDNSDAAAIISEMESDDQADIIMELEDAEAEAILSMMKGEEAKDLRRLMNYGSDTAGGLMVTEILAFNENASPALVISHLQKNRKIYKHFHIKYIFVVNQSSELTGVLRIQDLLFRKPEKRLVEIMEKKVLTINHFAPIQDLINFFDTYDYYAAPIVDDQGMLIGMVLRKDVLEARNEISQLEHLETQGIVGGDELRTMPLLLRSKRRLSWLSVNILLNIIAASVIAMYQDTLTAVIALAVFLPIISDMSGCSGNQAVAVSMRELSLGVVKPREALHVFFQEISVGLINGLSLGILLAGAAWIWQGNIYLGLVVGAALTFNTIVSVGLGGSLPLILKGRNIDPALASGPVLTTITDMFGFFLTLSFASAFLSYLQ